MNWNIYKDFQICISVPLISPDFLAWAFCGKAQFSHSFRPIARNYVETVWFCKISTPANQVRLQYFSQCKFCLRFCISVDQWKNTAQFQQCERSFWYEYNWNYNSCKFSYKFIETKNKNRIFRKLVLWKRKIYQFFVYGESHSTSMAFRIQ